jgi:hypothetical protein
MRRFICRGRLISAGVLACAFIRPTAAAAQANVPQFRGDFGMNSGTLPPPGGYVGFFYNNYRAAQVNGANAVAFPDLKPTINSAVGTASYTFPQSVLGGHWAATMTVPWTNVALETVNLDLPGSWGLGDVYVQPMKLGWRYPVADFVAGLGVFMPTGRFTAGADDNTGHGMWSYEASGGVTLFSGESRTGSASVLASYQVQSKVRDTDGRAGQLLTLEGGVGYSIPRTVGRIGLVYYAQWKTTMDEGFAVPPAFDARARMYGLGPEVTTPFPVGPVAGMVTMRYYIERGSIAATQGDSFMIRLTLYKSNR